jgi:nucleoside phosphorylase
MESGAMEKPIQWFDICIVCALPEEVRAFLEVVEQQCKVAFEKHISPRYHYSYRFTTIKNDKDESLNLHVSWLPRYGPQEMTLHLSRVLEECQPRIAIMTGICAGDAQHVQLGDLVVAERTFTYDNGKFTLDEHDRSVHLHDTMTYQLDANILQFLGLFDEWKPLIVRLERPPSPPEIRLKQREVRCHIKAMASGNAVRADNPFEDVRAPVRGTVAIDMEGAAFGLVMSRHPLIRWLVVKGVCDFADRAKSDAYHDYAARASALYAFSFIRAYVTNERLPGPDGHSPSSRAGPSGVWNVPRARNPHFTPAEQASTQPRWTEPTQSKGTKSILAAVTVLLFFALIFVLIVPRMFPNLFSALPNRSPSSPLPVPIHAYNFEEGAQGWEFVNTQPPQKQSLLQVAKSQGYQSKESLEVDTVIWGSQSATIPAVSRDVDVYTYTAIRVFFPHENDLGKKVSCYLYLPDSTLTGVYFRLFVISDKQDTDSYEYGKNKLYPERLAKNTWVELSMVIGEPENEKQPLFDPEHVNYIGMIIQGNDPNMGRTSVRVFLDDCTVT